jgi:hypothetical protein
LPVELRFVRGGKVPATSAITTSEPRMIDGPRRLLALGLLGLAGLGGLDA